MFPIERFHDLGTTYVIVDAHELRRARQTLTASLERVPRFEARGALERIIRREPSLCARLYEALTGVRLPAAGTFRLGAVGNPDALLAKMLDAFGLDQLSLDPGGADFARFYLLRERRGTRPAGSGPQTPESQRIEKALTAFGQAPFVHRGETYHLQRAGGIDAALPHGDFYETLSDPQLFAVLRALPEDTALPGPRRAAAGELHTAAEAQRRQRGSTELLLRRRQRAYLRGQEDSGPTLTPSQMRKALERHWVEVSAVDPDGKPVAGVALEIELADGSVRPATTNADGFARLEPVPPGNVLIRLPKIDGSGWRAAGAQSSGKKGPARVHAVKQGECLSSIALKYGFPDWELVWNHDKNADLRKKRKSPHVLRPGDKVTIPGLDIYEISRSTDATHQVALGEAPKLALDVVLEEFATEPLASRACVLRYNGNKGPEIIDGLNIDDQGRLQVDLPAYVRSVELEVEGLDEILVLNLGGLDPHSDHDDASALVLSGIEQRLHALAYSGPPRGVLDDALRDTLAAYQRRELGRSDATGEPDEETCSELEKAYGS